TIRGGRHRHRQGPELGLGLGAVLLGVDPALDLVGGDDGLLGSCVRPGRPSWSRAYRRVRGRAGKPAARGGNETVGPTVAPLRKPSGSRPRLERPWKTDP